MISGLLMLAIGLCAMEIERLRQRVRALEDLFFQRTEETEA